MNRIHHIFLGFVLSLFLVCDSFSQESLVQDYTQVLSIPSVSAIEASPTHLYILSETEGMAVFRIKHDELQWLYTSSGMQRRGNRISADVRFAYLAGENRRLTVLEPTSVLGVYSAALLPEKPLASARLQNKLYIALGNKGLGSLSLETPETVDSEIEIIDLVGQGVSVVDVISSGLTNQLFVLTENSKLDVFTSENNELTFSKSLNISQRLSRIFVDGNKLWGSTQKGDVFEITTNGLGRKVGNIGGVVENIKFWNGYTFIRSQSGKLWYAKDSNIIPWKTDSEAGNFIAKSGDQLWLVENNKVTKVALTTLNQNNLSTPTGPFSIKPIDDKILTYPNALLLGFEIDNGHSSQNVEFSVRSRATNFELKKQGFYWRPSPDQIGMNWFTVIATNTDGKTDSTRFTVDVRSFNTPPRFSPIRVSSIAVNEAFSLQIKAIDPEQPSSSLIRYIGVDLPEGASIDEETGTFSWKPTSRQTGEFSFRVIASDELGAASSQDVKLTVLDISREDGN